MRIGVGPFPLGGATQKQLLDVAEAAVAASFDSIWVAEARDEGVGGGLAAAAMIAQHVPIRVGAVVDFGRYHPLFLAEDIAVADLTCGGRIEVLLRGGTEEQVRLLVDALSGAHLHFEGPTLRVPAGLAANQPAPSKLALNPSPAQPVVPIWVDDERLAGAVGVGVATRWQPRAAAPRPSGRWPVMLLCPGEVEASDLLTAAGDSSPYFLVVANTPAEAASAGRRLVGPLRMPEFPEWIRQQ